MSARGPDPTAFADRALRDALLRFLLRERAAQHDGLDATYSLPVPARVDAGDAIAGATLDRWTTERTFELRAPFDHSGFRPGDRLRIGSGDEPESAPEVGLLENGGGRLVLEVPAYGGDRAAVERAMREATTSAAGIVLDRAPVDMIRPLTDALFRVFDGRGAVERSIRELLALRLAQTLSPGALAEAQASLAKLAARGYALETAQAEAFARSWAALPYQLVQGPPGTGKTFLLALLLAALAWRGERILVTAHTHLAVDNVMAALARIVAAMRKPLRLIRVTRQPGGLDPSLGVERAATARQVALGSGAERNAGAIVGATLLAALPFADRSPFHRVVFDEAAQVPLPHALCALLAAPRWLFFGDDCQLGPVVVGEHDDGLASRSVFAHLRQSAEPTLLDRTYRMNDAVCEFPSKAFYGGTLRPSPAAAARRFAHAPSGSRFDAILAPSPGAVLVRIAHEGFRTHCPPEVHAAADLAEELLARQGLSPDELAIVAPFRVQNRAIARELSARLPPGARLPVIDTVERIQGQEREAVIVSLTCSDPDALRENTAFFFSANRLCVTLTRARTKLVVLGSPHLLRTFPRDLEGLQRLDLFHRLFAELPAFDWPAEPPPSGAAPAHAGPGADDPAR